MPLKYPLHILRMLGHVPRPEPKFTVTVHGANPLVEKFPFRAVLVISPFQGFFRFVHVLGRNFVPTFDISPLRGLLT
jgi:hypothetical protein